MAAVLVPIAKEKFCKEEAVEVAGVEINTCGAPNTNWPVLQKWIRAITTTAAARFMKNRFLFVIGIGFQRVRLKFVRFVKWVLHRQELKYYLKA